MSKQAMAALAALEGVRSKEDLKRAKRLITKLEPLEQLALGTSFVEACLRARETH